MALITKLNEEVTDITLPKLGCYRVYAQNEDGSLCSVKIDNTNSVSHVEFIGDGTLCDSSGNPIAAYDTSSTSYEVYFKSTGGFVQISNKYTVSSVIVSSSAPYKSKLNIDDFAFSSGMSYLSSSYSNTFGSLKSLNAFTNNANVSINGSNITGNLSDIANKKFTSLSLRYTSLITGNFDDMPMDVAAAYTDINIAGSSFSVSAANFGKFVNATTISTDKVGVGYAAIADALYANGKVSGSVSITDRSTVAHVCTFTSSGWTES